MISEIQSRRIENNAVLKKCNIIVDRVHLSDRLYLPAWLNHISLVIQAFSIAKTR